MYHIYYGDYTIYGAESVDLTLSRPVTVYNGIGQGDFPVPDDKKLREWVIKCQLTERNDHNLDGWEPAHDVIAGLYAMMGSKEPERLVMTNGYDKTSVLALVTDVNAPEKYAGVYDVTIKLTEHKAASKRITGVPTITRPGKIPTPPPVVVFKNHTQVAGAAISRQTADMLMARDEWARKQQVYFYTDENGVARSTTNPNLVTLNTETRIEEVPKWMGEAAVSLYKTKEAVSEVWNGAKDTFSLAGVAMSKAIEEFKAQQKK